MPRTSAYAWIGAQVRIEAAICGATAGASGRALELLEEASLLARGHGYSELSLRAAAILSEQRFLLGDPLAPWVEGMRDLKVFWRSASRPNRSHQILFNQAWAAETAGLDYTALVLRQSAAREIAQTGNRAAELSAHLLAATSALRIRDAEQARASLDNAARIAPEISGGSGARRQALLELASTLVEAGDFEAARRYLEQGRALPGAFIPLSKALDLYVSGRLAEQGGDLAAAEESYLASREIEWRRFSGKAIPATSRLFDMERRRVDLAIRRGEPPAKALATWDSFQSGFDVDPVSASAHLQDEAFLTLVESGGRIHAWLATSSGIDHRALPRTAEFDAAAAALPLLCASPRRDPGEITRAARTVHDVLLAPFATMLARHPRTVIAADGALAQIPFAVLAGADGQPAGLAREIVRADSLGRYLKRTELPPVTSGDRALAFFSPALRPAVARLYSPITVRPSIIPVERRWRTTSFAGPAAHLANLDAHAADTALFLFWGHGARSSGRTSLLLAPGPARDQPEMLDAGHIDPSMWKSCRLAVLAACSSGGAAGPGGSDGLANGLLRAGVRNVIASRWDVEARPTSLLIGRFLAEISTGSPVSASLRTAMRAVHDADGTSHPYYWAAFEDFGAP